MPRKKTNLARKTRDAYRHRRWLAQQTEEERKARLARDRAYSNWARALETPIQRETRLALLRKRKAADRRNRLHREHTTILKEQLLALEFQHQEVTFVGDTSNTAINSKTLLRNCPVLDKMESDETTTAMAIKNEIDIEEEELIRVKTEIPDIRLDLETLQPENCLNTAPQTVILKPFHNIQTTIKQELDSAYKDNNYLVERADYTEKPTVIRDAASLITHGNRNRNIKEEIHESIVSYDYPNFDDAGSMDSSEAEALGNVETCLEDGVNVKTENCAQFEEPLKEDFRNIEIKIEPEIALETNTSNQIVPDVPDTVPQYSFVMKIPDDIMSNIDQILTTCLTNGTSDAESLNCEGEYTNKDIDMKISKNASEQTSLLQESDKSEMFNLNPFQLNSITGNVLSLEQEAYNMIKPQKNFRCPKCPKLCLTKYALLRHLKVHQTIDNYTNGRKKGLETKKKKALKKIQVLDKANSQDSCLDHQEIKVENKEGYKCTCGKTFQRRIRMESCFRSHDHTESEKYYCMTCLKDFKSKDELAVHRKRLHRKKFPCKFCPTDYATRKKLFRHLQIHQKVNQMEYKVIEELVKGKQKLRCFLCSKCCAEISELKVHVMSEHKGPYSCPHCKNTFPKIMDFGNHTKVYHPEVEGQSVLDVLEAFSRLTQEWKCEECDLQFLEADKLALHQAEQHSPEIKSEIQFQCLDCRRVFISQKGLTSHRRIHHSVETSDQPKVEVSGILCLECRTMCKDMTALTSHMRFHSPDRKYPCKFCDFRFATPEKRKTHAEIHTGDMKFVCFICEYQCSSENRLKKHKESLKHVNMQEYLLTGKPLIEASSSKDEDLKNCKSKKQKKSKDVSGTDGSDSNSESREVSCDVCGEKFRNESEMLEHKETHPFIEIPNADKPTRIFFK